MTIHFNRQRIEQALQDFRRATGINTTVYDASFESIGLSAVPHNDYCACVHSVSQGEALCARSDRGLMQRCRKTKTIQRQVCHAGLVDVCVPLLYEDAIIGYVILGQMKQGASFAAVAEKIAPLQLDPVAMERHYTSLPAFDEGRIESVVNVAVMLARYLLFENMVYPTVSPVVEAAAAFVERHLDQRLDVDTVAQNAGCSVGALYQAFRKQYGCTVGAFIARKRLEKAAHLLLETELSVETIAEQTGFAGVPYFSRSFKRFFGKSPLRYRKESEKD